jgi:basic membrane lipoprotein Med (substrate-binding protein (PBP1-ABC) superfamily)
MPDYQDLYRAAQKLGQREVRSLLARGQTPYPALLSEEIPYESRTLNQEMPRLMEIPAERIVGVRNVSRQSAFSAGFLPLLAEHTEFAAKWINLYRIHMEEGIRDPVTVYEFRNRYYVEEGNKRVSVLRYAGAGHIPAYVTRILPPDDGEKENNIYYAYLAFARASGCIDLYFSEEGRFERLFAALKKQPEEPWTQEEQKAFAAVFQRFSMVLARTDAKRLGISASDAFLAYVEIYGYDLLRTQSDDVVYGGMVGLKAEAAALNRSDGVRLSLNPTPASQAPLLNKLLPGRSSDLTVAFLCEKSPATSPWTASHESGRRILENAFAGKVRTVFYDGVVAGENDDAAMERAVEDGAEVIFAATPKLIGACVKAAVTHPSVKILNCSMNMLHPSIRTYYGRMYEAKFLVGAIAGALSESGRIGYLADYPIFGVPASINAFAYGAMLANPRAHIQLEWSCIAGQDPYEAFAKNNVTLISGRDLKDLEREDQSFGLYRQTPEGPELIALPFVRWGRMYTQIVGSILSGTWKAEESQAEQRTINYWWGLSSGMLDVLTSGILPFGTKRLMEVLREAVKDGRLNPLVPFPESYPAESEQTELTSPAPEEILTMSTLAANVSGSIPSIDALIQEAKPLVRLQGLGDKGGLSQ